MKMKHAALSVALGLACALSARAAAPAAPVAAPVADPGGLLAPAAKARIGEAAARFRAATGRWMAVVVGPKLGEIGEAARVGGEAAQPGLVLVMARDEPDLRLVLLDPDWRAAAPAEWPALIANRTETRFRSEPFARRVVSSVELLADILPDKLAFMTRPPSNLGEGSYAFARYAMKAIEAFVWVILLYTLYRTIRENRLKDTDTDPFSQELRRLREERSIW